jgi:hypothetical protein
MSLIEEQVSPGDQFESCVISAMPQLQESQTLKLLQNLLITVFDELLLPVEDLKAKLCCIDSENAVIMQHQLVTSIRALREAVEGHLMPCSSLGSDKSSSTANFDIIQPVASNVPPAVVPTAVHLTHGNTTGTAFSVSLPIEPHSFPLSDWIEYTECLEPPAFGLRSEVMDHLFSTWTTDKNKVCGANRVALSAYLSIILKSCFFIYFHRNLLFERFIS